MTRSACSGFQLPRHRMSVSDCLSLQGRVQLLAFFALTKCRIRRERRKSKLHFAKLLRAKRFPRRTWRKDLVGSYVAELRRIEITRACISNCRHSQTAARSRMHLRASYIHRQMPEGLRVSIVARPMPLCSTRYIMTARITVYQKALFATGHVTDA